MYFRELFLSGVAEVQLVYITATNSNVAVLASGFFKLAYGGASTAFLSVGISDLELASVLMNLQTTGTVTVSQASTGKPPPLSPHRALCSSSSWLLSACVWLGPRLSMQDCRAGPHHNRHLPVAHTHPHNLIWVHPPLSSL